MSTFTGEDHAVCYAPFCGGFATLPQNSTTQTAPVITALGDTLVQSLQWFVFIYLVYIILCRVARDMYRSYAAEKIDMPMWSDEVTAYMYDQSNLKSDDRLIRVMCGHCRRSQSNAGKLLLVVHWACRAFAIGVLAWIIIFLSK